MYTGAGGDDVVADRSFASGEEECFSQAGRP
jgi:hypothetical protein